MHILTLSARSESALRATALRYADHIGTSNTTLAGICRAASTQRSHFSYRTALVAGDTAEMRDKLTQFAASGEVNYAESRRLPAIAFIFSGQGTQYAGMGSELFANEPVFRETLLECDELLRRQLPRPLLAVLYPQDGDSALIDDTQYTQPALFAVEVALYRLWRSWGIVPQALIGHSIGEYAAAHAAGVLSLDDALRLVTERARQMQAAPGCGAMASIFAGAQVVAEALRGLGSRVSIAAINTPSSTVISGDADSVGKLMAEFTQRGIQSRRLLVSHAFHSPLMDLVLDEFERTAAGITYKAPTCDLISNLTGGFHDRESISPVYWRQHLREPVQFLAGMQTLAAKGIDCFIEIGPRPALIVAGQLCLPEQGRAWLPSLRGNGHDTRVIRESLAALYATGCAIDWRTHHSNTPAQSVRLPHYQFQRSRHWHGSSTLFTTSEKITEAAAPHEIGPVAMEPLPAPSDDPAELVLCTVAAIAELPRPDIRAEQRLHEDLGFDSLMLIDLKKRLAKRYPQAIDRLPLSLLFSNATIGGLIDFLLGEGDSAKLAEPDISTDGGMAAQALFDGWARQFEPGRRIDRKLVHKSVEQNVLVARIAQLAEHSFAGEITQDTQHTFFYEHAKDHVPGLYIIEAARQFGTAVAHLHYGVSSERPFVLNEIEARFQRFVETARPLFVKAHATEQVYAGGVLSHMKCSAEFIQDGHAIGTITGVFQVIDPHRYETLRATAAVHNEGNEIHE